MKHRETPALRYLRQAAAEHGFDFVRYTKSGHYQWRHRSSGVLVVTSSKRRHGSLLAARKFFEVRAQ